MIGSVCVCRDECESVVHVLWELECPVYDSIRNIFTVICWGGV